MLQICRLGRVRGPCRVQWGRFRTISTASLGYVGSGLNEFGAVELGPPIIFFCWNM
jgi:hypothetical protein